MSRSAFVHGLCHAFHFCHPCGVWRSKPGPLDSLADALSDRVSGPRQRLTKLHENVDSRVAFDAGNAGVLLIKSKMPSAQPRALDPFALAKHPSFLDASPFWIRDLLDVLPDPT